MSNQAYPFGMIARQRTAEEQLIHENFIKASPESRAACQDFVIRELRHEDLDHENPFMSDHSFSYTQRRSDRLCNDKELDHAIITLYFRSRVQRGFLNVFGMLLEKDYINLDCLRYGLSASMEETTVLHDYLLCMSDVSYVSQNRPAGIHSASYDVIHMAHWLATMIQRSWQGDLNSIIEKIIQSGFLGDLTQTDLEKIHSPHSAKEGYTITRNPECNRDMKAKSKLMVGWILPHNAGNVTDAELLGLIADGHRQADCVEGVYKKYFNLSEG